jgi:glutaredoxin
MSNKVTTPTTPSALMLLSTSCAHCPGVLDALAKMIKAGDIARLEVINLEQTPEAMQQYNVRSVPWVRIGTHVLTGAQTLDALKQRAQWAKDEQSEDAEKIKQITDFDFLLSDGQVNKVIESISKNQTGMESIMALLGDSGTVLSTRIGIGVVFEEYAGADFIKDLIPQLGELIQHDDVRIRADAYHYLGLTKDKKAIPYLEKGKDDTDEEIKEIATDSLDDLFDD